MSSPAYPIELIKAEIVARWLQCSRAVVYSEAKKGNLPCVIVGEKLVRFERQAIEEYIAARRRAG